MTADEAQTISNEANLKCVFDLIKEAATQGKFKVHLNEEQRSTNKIQEYHFKHLIGLGYTITPANQDVFGDEFCTWEISWG